MQLVAIIVIVAVVAAVAIDALVRRSTQKAEPYREQAIVTTQKIIVDLTKRR